MIDILRCELTLCFGFWIANLSTKFRIDVNVNPLDVEEIVWDIASLSRLDSSAVPPPSMMSLPKGKTDRRKIMVRFFPGASAML